MDSPKRAIGYIRVSSLDQAEGYSLEDQESELRKVGEKEDFELVDIVRESKTGTNLNREGLQKILKKAKNGEIDYLFVVRLDRLSRDILDTFHVLRLLREQGVKVGVTEWW